MTDPLIFWSAAVLAAVLVGMAKGGLPMVGMLSVPIMSLLISPVAAAGLLLPVYVASDVFGVWAYRRQFDRRNLLILVPGALAGVGFGWATAALMPERAVTAIVGLVGGSFALMQLLRRGPPPEPRPARVAPGLFWGVLSGFTSFVSHAGAPPYQIYVLPQRMPKAVFAGTTTIFFAIVNAAKLLPYAMLGQLGPDTLRQAALLLPPAIAAVWLGVALVRILPERRFFLLVTWALLLVSVQLLWQAARG